MKLEKQRQTNKLFIMSIQDEEGYIVKILFNSNYDELWLLGTTESKVMRGYWSIHKFPDGAFVDGNFRSLKK